MPTPGVSAAVPQGPMQAALPQVPGAVSRDLSGLRMWNEDVQRFEEVNEQEAKRIAAEKAAQHAQQELEQQIAEDQAAKAAEEQAAKAAEEQAAGEAERKRKNTPAADEAARGQHAKWHKRNWQGQDQTGRGDKPRGSVGHSAVINVDDDDHHNDKWGNGNDKGTWDSSNDWRGKATWDSNSWYKGKGNGKHGKLGCIVL